MMKLKKNAALIVIDVQKAFDQSLVWGTRNNPHCEENIVALCDMWQSTGRPIVCVQHTSRKMISPFASWSPSRNLKNNLMSIRFNVTIEKKVNSAFIGTPDLHSWLMERDITQVVIVGIQTNMCVETTARVAGNLGYDTSVPIDATHTFDITYKKQTISASELTRITAANLTAGKFAKVVLTDDIIGLYQSPTSSPPPSQIKEITGEY